MLALDAFLKGQVVSGGQQLGQMSLLELPLTPLAPESPTLVQGPWASDQPCGGFCFHLCLWPHNEP